MNKEKENKLRQTRRHKRIRAKISGTASKPRLSVFRSNKGFFLQLIDDENGNTLVSADIKEMKSGKGAGMDRAFELGKILAKKALEKKIKEAVFDKGSYRYHGKVKAIAEGAREGGLEF